MKHCAICQKEFSSWVKIDGKRKNLQRRKYCLECSPFGLHNTIKIENKVNHNCIICNNKLKETQLKYCSKECKKDSRIQNNRNWYPNQKIRGLERKKQLVILKGGKCEKCGYSKNIGAFDFHHRDPSTKVSELDIRVLSNRTLKFCLEEAEKCMLLCSNCHREHHYPDLNNW